MDDAAFYYCLLGWACLFALYIAAVHVPYWTLKQRRAYNEHARKMKVVRQDKIAAGVCLRCGGAVERRSTSQVLNLQYYDHEHYCDNCVRWLRRLWHWNPGW